MKVFITGITGFVGRNLRSRLPGDHEYFALIRNEQSIPGVTTIAGDLNHLDGFKKQLLNIQPDVCIHLAWEGIPDYSQAVSERNLKNSSALFQFLCNECGVGKIVSTGSCWEYGKKFGACLEADTVPESNSLFVRAKEEIYRAAHKSGKNLIWLRFFYVYGPGQREGALIPTLVKAVRNKQMPAIKTPLDANDYVYIDDAVEAVITAAFSKVAAGIYNIGSGRSTPVWQVCDIVEKALGSTTDFAGRLKQSTAPKTADFWADTQLASEQLHWHARTALADGIRAYIEKEGMSS